MTAPIELLRRSFGRELYLPDPGVVEVVAATAVAHLQGGDMWMHVVGPPGSGKTEAIRSLDGLAMVHPLSSLTSKTLFSGLRCPRDEDGREILALSPSLMVRMQHQRPAKTFLTLKDFTTVLQMRRDDRSEILAQLREVYDGSYVRETGSGATISWEGRVGVLTGVTPVIDSYRSVMAVLGERFLYFRMADLSEAGRDALAVSAMGHGDEDEMRARLRRAMSKFVRSVDLGAAVPAEDEEFIVRLATVASWVRTGVIRDEYRLEVQTRPQLDAPTRIARQLAALHAALVSMGHEDPRQLTQRVARDSVPRDRWDTVMLLTAGPSTNRGLCEGLGMPRSQYKTVSRMMEDLEMLGLVDAERDERQHMDDDPFAPIVYSLTPSARKAVGPLVPENGDEAVTQVRRRRFAHLMDETA